MENLQPMGNRAHGGSTKAGLVAAGKGPGTVRAGTPCSGSLLRKSVCWSDGGLHIYKAEIDSETWKANL